MLLIFDVLLIWLQKTRIDTFLKRLDVKIDI